MDGYTWERRESHGGDVVQIDEVDALGSDVGVGSVLVNVDRFAEFAAWVQGIQNELETAQDAK